MSAAPWLVWALLVSLTVTPCGCAGILGIEQADLIDEPSDSGPDNSDSQGGATCGQYCDCMGQNCTDRFADEAACLGACSAFTPQQLACRIYHCGAAAQDPSLHCPHALGITLCQ